MTLTPDGRSHKRNTYAFGLRYTPGTDLARRFPKAARGRFSTAADAERIRVLCPNADDIQVVDVRTGEVAT